MTLDSNIVPSNQDKDNSRKIREEAIQYIKIRHGNVHQIRTMKTKLTLIIKKEQKS